MPAASELQLPEPAIATSLLLDASSESEKTSEEKPVPAQAQSQAAGTMSVRSFELNDADSTFSSLLRSVAAREQGERIRSVGPAASQALSDRSFVVVDNLSHGGQGVQPASARPLSILAVLEADDQEARLGSIQAWIQQQQSHLRLASNTREAGSSTLATGPKEPAPVQTAHVEKLLAPSSRDTDRSLHVDTDDASVDLSDNARRLPSSIVASTIEASWLTMPSEHGDLLASSASSASEDEAEPSAEVRLSKPLSDHTDVPTFLEIIGTVRGGLRLVFVFLVPLLGSYIWLRLSVSPNNTPLVPTRCVQEPVDMPHGDSDLVSIPESDPPRLIQDPAAVSAELHRSPSSPQKSLFVEPRPRNVFTSTSAPLLPPTRTLPPGPSGSLTILLVNHRHVVSGFGAAVLSLLVIQWALKKRRPSRRRKYIVVKKRMPSPAGLPKPEVKEEAVTDDFLARSSTAVKPMASVPVKQGSTRRVETPRKSDRAKARELDSPRGDEGYSRDSPRRSPRLAKKAITAAAQDSPSGSWRSNCARERSRLGSSSPVAHRAHITTPVANRQVTAKVEEAVEPAPLDRPVQQKYAHVVRVHGIPDVGKSSIIRSARSLDMLSEKADAGISLRSWVKDGAMSTLIFCDSNVTTPDWEDWRSRPENVKYGHEQQGRTVHLVVHADDVPLSSPAALAIAAELLREEDSSLVAIIRNKADLIQGGSAVQSPVQIEEVAKYMLQMGIPANTLERRLRWFAMSADNGDGVGDAFRTLCRELRRRPLAA